MDIYKFLQEHGRSTADGRGWVFNRCLTGEEINALNANYQRPPIKDVHTRKQALDRIHAEQLEIFLSRDGTRGSHNISVRTCADIIVDKGERLMNQWKEDKPFDEEELLDIMNYATIALFVMRGVWDLPWGDKE